MITIGLIALGVGFGLGLLAGKRARKLLAEVQSLLTQVEVRLGRLETAVKTGVKD
jgi:hypothetical protein